MPDPAALRVLPLVLFVPLFIVGLVGRPIFFPISYMTLWLTKLANYYPFVTDFKVELLVASVGLLFVFAKCSNNANIFLSPRKNLVHKYLLYLLACMAISFMIAWDKQYSWDIKIYDFTKVLILYLMITLSVEKESDLSIFIWFFVLLYVYLAYEPVYGFLNKTGGFSEMYGETYVADSGLLSGHVALANNMNQMIPFAYFLFMGSRNKVLKFFALFALIIFMVCLVGSKSRGGVAGFLMLGAFIVYFSKKRLRNGILVVFIVGVMFISSGDMEATMSRIDSTSAHGRLSGLTNGLEMILKGNILGVGPGCYLIARSYYFSYRMESHNIYGQVMGDLGIPGTIAAFFLIRQVFRYLVRTRRRLEKQGQETTIPYYITMALTVSLATRLFSSLGSHGLYFYYYYVVAALSFSVAHLSGVETSIGSLKKMEKWCQENE